MLPSQNGIVVLPVPLAEAPMRTARLTGLSRSRCLAIALLFRALSCSMTQLAPQQDHRCRTKTRSARGCSASDDSSPPPPLSPPLKFERLGGQLAEHDSIPPPTSAASGRRRWGSTVIRGTPARPWAANRMSESVSLNRARRLNLRRTGRSGDDLVFGRTTRRRSTPPPLMVGQSALGGRRTSVRVR